MKNLSEIKQRIKSVSDTQKITKAMETISISKMRKFLEMHEINVKYFEKLTETIKDIASRTRSESRYFSEINPQKKAYIVISSDKGLAGGFNHNILTFAKQKLAEETVDTELYIIGQTGRDFFYREPFTINDDFIDIGFDPKVVETQGIAATLDACFSAGDIDEVNLIYTKTYSSSKMDSEMIRLLPLGGMRSDGSENGVETEYEPSEDEVLDSIIPMYLSGVIYGALLSSAAGEHSSRRNAMNNAASNATEILDALTIDYNRARQESITNDISEIVTAAMGVQNEKH